MKGVPRIALAPGMIAMGFAAGALWQQSRRQHSTEDAVAKEFRLLEAYKAVPSCEQLKGATSGRGEQQAAGAVVHWRRVDRTAKVARVVVADDLTVAYDEVNDPCTSAAEH